MAREADVLQRERLESMRQDQSAEKNYQTKSFSGVNGYWHSPKLILDIVRQFIEK